MAVADGGMVYVFERAEGDKDYYKRERSFKIENNAVKIKNLAVSPSEEQLVCTLANCQAYVLPLSNTDILKSDEMNFELLSQAPSSIHSREVDANWVWGVGGRSGRGRLGSLDGPTAQPVNLWRGRRHSTR